MKKAGRLLAFVAVLFFAGSGSSRTRFEAQNFGNVADGVFVSVVWDPNAAPPNNFMHPATLFAADGNLLDIRSNVKRMWIAGREVSLESRHTRLYQKYKARPRMK